MLAPLLLALLLAGQAPAEEKEVKNPFAGDPVAIQHGRSLFHGDCALCHGRDARGGRGPDLTTGRWTHGSSDAALFRTITKGVPGTEMSPSGLRDPEIWMIVAYLRSLTAGPPTPITGNREAGEKIFQGTGLCSQCHMVNGKGGRLGPDLSRIGASRSVRYLTESIREPSKEMEGWEPVTAVTKNGKRITGVRKNEDTFSLQLMDPKEEIHLFLKKDLREVIYEKKSLMPEYNDKMLSDKDLEDLLAYLDSLRGQKQ